MRTRKRATNTELSVGRASVEGELDPVVTILLHGDKSNRKKVERKRVVGRCAWLFSQAES